MKYIGNEHCGIRLTRFGLTGERQRFNQFTRPVFRVDDIHATIYRGAINMGEPTNKKDRIRLHSSVNISIWGANNLKSIPERGVGQIGEG